MVQDLHRVDILALSTDEKLAFFLNLYNAMVIHAVIRGGRPNGVIDRRSFFSDFQYLVGGNVYSLNIIKNGILRNNRRSPYSLMKPFSNGDKRLEVKTFLSTTLSLFLIYVLHSNVEAGTAAGPSKSESINPFWTLQWNKIKPLGQVLLTQRGWSRTKMRCKRVLPEGRDRGGLGQKDSPS